MNKHFYALLWGIAASFFVFPAATYANNGYVYLEALATHFGIPLPEYVLTFILVFVLTIILGLCYKIKVARKNDKLIPDQGITLPNLMEAYGSFIYNQCSAIIGEKEGPRYFEFFASLFLLLLLNNLIGLIPGILPPTQNFNTTLPLGIIAFIYYNWQGIREQGIIKYIKHFMGPIWYMAVLFFPLEIISNGLRPLSLAFRLRGNIYGDHMVVGIMSEFVPYLLPIVFMLFGLMVAILQAYVFSLLTMVYINLATVHEGEEAH